MPNSLLNVSNYQGQQFRAGGMIPAPDNSTVGVQLVDADLSRIVIEEARWENPFTQMSPQTFMRRHRGNKFKLTISLPIIDSRNYSDGLDYLGLKIVPNKWYAYTADDVRTEHTSEAAAKASPGQVRVQNGGGNFYGSSRDFAIQVGSFPIAGEVVGNVNEVGYKRTVVECIPQRYAFKIPLTRRSIELDTDVQLQIRTAKEMGNAYSKIREAVTRNGLIGASMVNAYYCGNAAQISEIDETSKLTLKDLRKFNEALNIARVPLDTNILTGSTNYGTTPVEAARYFYIPLELENTLRDLTHNGRLVFEPFADYAGQVKTAKDELGRIEGFRFIRVNDMPSWFGAGADATDGLDADGDGIEDAGQELRITDGKYDVYSLLFVGPDSHLTVGIEGLDAISVHYNRPVRVPGIDDFGDKASFTCEWNQGLIVTRPERLGIMFCAAE